MQRSSQRRYWTFNYPNAKDGSKTLLTGIRPVRKSHKVYICGFYKPPPNSIDNQVITFMYKGYKNGKGIWYELAYPSAPGRTVINTNLYGPNNGLKKPKKRKKRKCCHCHKNDIQVVGNYVTEESGTSTIGCLYQGPLDGTGKWTTIIPEFEDGQNDEVLNTIAHSTMGGLVVGNYDTTLIQGKAFIYDIKTRKYYDIVKPGAKSITAYGIWYNGEHIDNGKKCSSTKHSYTICGGYSDVDHVSGVDSGHLVDWDNKTHTFSNWRSYSYDNNPAKAIITHFDGISSDGKGGYYLTGDCVGLDKESKLGFIARIKRCRCGEFRNKASWRPISFPGYPVTSGNSVDGKTVIGVYTSLQSDQVNGYISY